jgi:hypothetical protein
MDPMSERSEGQPRHFSMKQPQKFTITIEKPVWAITINLQLPKFGHGFQESDKVAMRGAQRFVRNDLDHRDHVKAARTARFTWNRLTDPIPSAVQEGNFSHFPVQSGHLLSRKLVYFVRRQGHRPMPHPIRALKSQNTMDRPGEKKYH